MFQWFWIRGGNVVICDITGMNSFLSFWNCFNHCVMSLFEKLFTSSFGFILNSDNLFLSDVCHLFFTIVSVLPGKNFAISAHLLPSKLCFSTRMQSSMYVHGPLLIDGFKCPFHLSLHCFGVLASFDAMILQLFGP